MSKDVRRLFAAQKAAKAGGVTTSSPSSSSLSSTSSASKRITHPLAKYDPRTLRLTCAICGPAAPIKSDSLWNAHLVSKAHQEAVAKLRTVKEQMQRKEAEVAEQKRLKQEEQQRQLVQGQGVKRKAVGGLVAYADNSDSDNDDEEATTTASPMLKQTAVASDFKRVRIDNDNSKSDDERRKEQEQEVEEEEEAMAGLPAGFFDTPQSRSSEPAQDAPYTSIHQEHELEPDAMEGVLPAGFFDDPEEDARVRAEVGGATTDQQQRQIDAEFKALEADLARDLERQERQEAQLRAGQQVDNQPASTNGATSSSSERIGYEEKVELEEQELEESIMARSEEEYMLFLEMQARLEALQEKKNRLLSHQTVPSPSPSTPPPSMSKPSISTQTKTGKMKTKSILELVREQEHAKKEKERQAAAAFARANREQGDSKMESEDGEGEDEDESDEDDEDIEAMMDWRAKRV
ncbi:hypothetical protein FBU30_005223 [Linnemannia zychae]|nr:hypothetical protein FBU30_005223 [Linnemannia zychae]